MKYKQEDIEKLVNSLRIEEVVGEFIELKKAGANYKGLCPFHQDTKPSFMVSPTKNICKCFVCGAGGNPINFYSKYKKISYLEAISELSKKYNIEIKSYSKIREDKNKEYYDIMEVAHQYYKDLIFQKVGQESLEYLSGRAIDPLFIKKNGIGYASGEWSSLYNELIKKGFSKEKILELGLAKEGENGIYDTFRNRVIFPIYSINGRVIAFGGRSLVDDKNIPKYINSAETPIFIKGNNLYGFVDKGANIRKKDYTILMEGYMDVLSAHNYGFDVTLAPLGTALTESQVQLLKNYTKNVLLSFDMDTAGQTATEKAIMLLKKEGFNIRILNFIDAKDPDEYLKKFGREKFLKVVKDSLEVFDYLYLQYSKEYNLQEHISKQKFIERFKEFFINVQNDLEKSLYLDKLSKSLNISETILYKVLVEDNKKIVHKFIKKEEIDQKNRRDIGELEKITLALILVDKKYLDIFRNKKFEHTLSKDILLEIEENIESKDILKSLFHDKNENISEEILAELSFFIFSELSTEMKREFYFRDIFSSWFLLELKDELDKRENILKQLKLKEIETKLKSCSDFSEIYELYGKFQEICF